MKKRDLTDPFVFRVCDVEHVPQETYDDGMKFSGMACEACGEDWPCTTRVELGITSDGLTSFIWDGNKYMIVKDDGGDKLILKGEVYDLTIGDNGDVEIGDGDE